MALSPNRTSSFHLILIAVDSSVCIQIYRKFSNLRRVDRFETAEDAFQAFHHFPQNDMSMKRIVLGHNMTETTAYETFIKLKAIPYTMNVPVTIVAYQNALISQERYVGSEIFIVGRSSQVTVPQQEQEPTQQLIRRKRQILDKEGSMILDRTHKFGIYQILILTAMYIARSIKDVDDCRPFRKPFFFCLILVIMMMLSLVSSAFKYKKLLDALDKFENKTPARWRFILFRIIFPIVALLVIGGNILLAVYIPCENM